MNRPRYKYVKITTSNILEESYRAVQAIMSNKNISEEEKIKIYPQITDPASNESFYECLSKYFKII